MLNRQRVNPSSVVRNFRQGWSRVAEGSAPFWTSVRLLLDTGNLQAPPFVRPGLSGHLLAP